MHAAIRKNLTRSRNALSPPAHLRLFHSTPTYLAKSNSKCDSKTYIRYTVRQKRSDAKSALNDLIFNRKPSGSSHDFDKNRQAKHIGRSKPCSSPHLEKGKRSRNKRWQNRQSFYHDDCEHPDTAYSATFGGQRSFTWSFGSGETLHFQNSTTGFDWKDDSETDRARKRIWSESDVEDESDDIGLQSHRLILGLPPTGPLELDAVKCAFHKSALKWHPDKHQGPLQAKADEKFKLCVDAYNSLCKALKSG